MLALILDARTDLARTKLLGLSLRRRAALSAAEAGATVLLVEQGLDAWVRELRLDPRLSSEVRPRSDALGDCLVVRADALVSPSLLAELSPGECILDELRAEPCAARVFLTRGDDASAALANAKPRASIRSGERYAVVVRDRDDLIRARRALLASLVKPSDGPVSRHLNRHLSRALTRVCVWGGLRPNQMTVLVALAGVAAGFFAAHPEYRMQLLGAFLFQVHSVIDGCDGEIARLTRRFGKHGALIDSLVDDASNALFFAGLSLGVGQALHATWPLVAGLFTVACYVGVAYIQYAVVLRNTGKGEKTAFWQGSLAEIPRWRRVLHALGRRDVFVLTILGAVALGLAPVVVVALPCMALGALVQSAGRARALRGRLLA